MSSTTGPTGPSPRPSKAQRRDDARAEALRLREEQQRQARRQRIIVVTLLVAGLVVVGGLIAFIFTRDTGTDPDYADLPASEDFDDVEEPLADVAAPSTATDSGGILVGEDGAAGATDVPDGAVVVTVYADYMCPICGQFEQTNGPLLDKLREAGEIVVEYKPVSILDRAALGSRYSTRAGTAAAFVADRAPEAFAAFNEALFASQPKENTTGLTNQEIADVASGAGAPDDVSGAIADGSYLEGDDAFTGWVAAASQMATREFAPQFGTPTILVDGQNLADLKVDWRVEGALQSVIDQARG
jgi:protein-disulfide isomerase